MIIIVLWNVTPCNLAEKLFYREDAYFSEALIKLYQATLFPITENINLVEHYLQGTSLLASEMMGVVCAEDEGGQIPFNPLNTKMNLKHI
jgi:hypothetical protein